MDSREHEELSRELLEREIETALDIDPSPEFLARLRTRIADEHVGGGWAWPGAWRWATVPLAVITVAVVGLWIVRESRSTARDTQPVNASSESESGRDKGLEARTSRPEPQLPTVGRARDVVVSREARPVVAARETGTVPSPIARSEVLISQDEAAALRQLFAAISNRRLETSLLPDLDAALQPPAPIEDIVLEPLSVSPLASLESE